MSRGGSSADYRNNSLKVKFDIPEVQKVMNHFKMYNAKTQAKIRSTVKSSLKNIEKGAQRRVPHRTGELAKSITSNFDMRTASGSVTANKFYAHIPEFGSKYVRERPYMRPAFEDEKHNLIKGIKDAVKP